MSERAAPKQRDNPTFVARIWPESAENGETRWRGRVKHIQGNTERYFHDLTELEAFLEEVIAAPPGPAKGPDAA